METETSKEIAKMKKEELIQRVLYLEEQIFVKKEAMNSLVEQREEDRKYAQNVEQHYMKKLSKLELQLKAFYEAANVIIGG